MLTAFVNGRLFGTRYGSDTPNVLSLHGWGGTHAQMRALIENRNAVSLDLPGFGSSPPPPHVWGAADYASCVAAVLEEMSASVVIVGYSFGGRVALNLAVTNPDRVSALVLTGVPLVRKAPARKPPLAFRMMRTANRLGVISDARMETERRKRGSSDYRKATGVMRDVLVKVVNESYESELSQILCPTYLVWGEKDTEVPLAVAERACSLIGSHAELTVLPDVGHDLPLVRPDALNDVLNRIRLS